MFNYSLKNEALKIHKNALEIYNASNEKMNNTCEKLYSKRKKSVEVIKMVENVINSVANTPKDYNTKMGKVHKELNLFKETIEYANKAYDDAVKAGVNIVGGVATGVGVAAFAPTGLMSLATTFGTASTGTAISALSGAAAQKAAVAWLGRTFAGAAVKQGAGMAVGKVFLSLAGPVGWGISAISTGASLISFSDKNRKLSDDIITEAKDIAKAKEELDETTERINELIIKTCKIYNDINKQRKKISSLAYVNYNILDCETKTFLGTLVNNTLSLSELINKNIE